ncbi:MAG TPA: NAD(P)-dependent oxidoreductase [Erysipelotrichaceae bacterium]|jgi:lactate dehydrogenase-like 2-hydroxyacid dehydrogenase|nr:hydroxyacid dehydrogenase [Erysipelotrichia bacterium]HPX33205.1 NAD(P)-dependent oxidoreductase [Erysipelotrichaceae bacterium]HQA85677.1 NAD(P)-dependent oxidoreductase [Erysipelotrichaceae bacterium]
MKISIIEPLGIKQEKLEDLLAEIFKEHEITFYSDRKEDEDTLIERCKMADIIVLTNIKLSKNVLEKCTNLKYICVAFTGFNHIDMDYCNQNNILVSNCAGYSTNAVTELVFGLIINIYRHINEHNLAIRNGAKTVLSANEIANKKFGIVGLGTIGTKVATIAKAFDCDVYYYSKNSRNKNFKYLELDELLQTCDIVSIHLAQNEDTINLINEEKIALMKKNSILINTARGPIVNSVALAKALNDEKIKAAGIDVYEMEPPIDLSHPLLNCKNCLTTPHIAFSSYEALEKRAIIVKDNLIAYLNGKPINVIK